MNFDPEIQRICELVDFTPIKNKSILITGATGFVGNWLRLGLKAASKQGVSYSFIGLDHSGYNRWIEVGSRTQFDYVFHLAPRYDKETLKRLYEQRRAQVLFSSSGAVYHEHLNDYGKAKIAFEVALIPILERVKIARLYTFSGAWLRGDNFAAYNFIRNAWLGLPIRIYGDGKTVRSYMYGADMSIWLWNIMLYGKQHAYHVGSENAITIGALANMVSGMLDPHPQVIVENRDMVEQARYYVPDTKPERDELDLKETYSIQEGMTRYMEWVYENL